MQTRLLYTVSHEENQTLIRCWWSKDTSRDADAALRAVLAHEVKVNDVYANSAAVRVAPDAEGGGGGTASGSCRAAAISCKGARCVRTGRARFAVPGHRLVHRRFQRLPAAGGAASVACVDVNYGQLACEAAARPARERVRAREHQAGRSSGIGRPFDVLVADLARFIGLAALAPVFARLLSSRAPYS